MERPAPPRKRYLLCSHCDPPTYFPDLQQLSTHLTTKHGARQNFSCGQCRRLFIHKTSVIRHITEKHINQEEEGSDNEEEQRLGGPSASSPPSPTPSTSLSTSCVASEEEDGEGNTFAGGNENETPKDIVTEAAMFLLKLRSSGNMTNTSVLHIQNYVRELLVNVLKNVRQNTEEFLTNCGVSYAEAAEFLSGPTFHMDDPFANMKTVDDQLTFFCEKFGLVISEEKMLSSRIENRFDRGLRRFLPTRVLETFQSISLIDSLSFIVRNPYLRSLIFSEKASDDGVYRSYLDGSDFKNNTFLQRYPNAIRIILYYDDLEIASALGSKDVIHKLGCFYFAIQNFPPEESTLISSIFLLALAYAEDLKKPGAFAKVLTPFIADLERLCSDEGVEIDLPDGNKFILRACLVTVCADALAAHALLGLLSPSADKFCRLCLVTKTDIKNDSTCIGLLRTVELHKQHVKDVLEGRAQPKQYGVKEESPLVKVMKVPHDSTFDAFHDLVGIIQMVLKLALYEYICVRKLFTTADFNSNLNMFVFGSPDTKNKPSPSFMYSKLCGSGHTLKQSGSQTFCLLRIFPFVIRGVEEGDEILELVFLLQDIVKIILSPEVSEQHILQLENLVRQHNNLFHQLFVNPNLDIPDVGNENDDNDNEDEDGEDHEEDVDDPVGDNTNEERQEGGRRRIIRRRKKLKKGINKLHHLLHYADQMREKGPVGRLWTAKFEARHRIFRKHSAVQSNFKNPPKTMAKMFQLSTLGSVLSRTGCRTPVFSGHEERVPINNSPYYEHLLRNGFTENDSIITSKCVELCGIEYGVGLFVQLKDNTSILPSFAIIIDVIHSLEKPENVFLAVSKCTNYGLSRRYNSYHISNEFDLETTIVGLKDLASHRVIAPWTPVEDSDVNLYLYPRFV
ncbi:Ras-responsive element-binding protein 1 [Frankliniella fusca]|uniref:Ras-responsive element-binding protein 1 n=1 Tax=Frankliniella fusca TaxID=407009 RepID=A0AAE1GYG3_9NEOP|nr:Ras-responsive element-binding protein 1 [Frankliniella fusca]